MKTGFFQVYLRKEDREVTAFSIGKNLYQFKVLPMGVRNGPSTFQRLMDKVLGKTGLLGHICEVLIDDIIVFSVTWEEHVRHLRQVLECLREAGLTTSIEKSRFFLTEADYLGHGVSENGIFTDGAKVEAIRNYPSPRDRRELGRFLGMVGWFSKFIPNCATISEPLYSLRRKSVRFTWSDECENAFLELKDKLSSAPCLAHPDPTGDYELHTDASGVGLGACLNQVQGGILRPIGYSSRTLNSAERNYSATEREILAVVWALEKWRPYIEGKHVVVVTDHMALTWIFTTKTNLSPRLYRWVLRVQEFDIEIKYRKGRLHVVPDALSRDHRFDPVLSVGVIDVDTGDDCDHVRCLKPTTEIIDWIQCNQCLRWFHDECVGVDPELAKEMDFLCDRCNCNKGTHHTDVTSPLPNLEGSTGMKLVGVDQLSHLQRDDQNLRKLIDYIEDPKGAGDFVSPKVKNLAKDCVIDQILYRNTDSGQQIFVPNVLKHHILYENHDSPISGHLGRKKTLHRILKNFYWVGIGKDVKNYCRSCETCQRVKPVYRKPQGFMEPIFSGGPWEILAADLVGPLPTSHSNHKFILVVRDHFSKWVEVFPLKQRAKQLSYA